MAICQLAVAGCFHLANMARMANLIRQQRKSRSVTLEELAEKTGISTSHLSRIETGERGLDLENAVKIARALGCEVTDFTSEFSEEDIAAASNLPLPGGKGGGDVANLTIHAGMGNGGLQVIEGAAGKRVPPEFMDGYWSFPASIRDRFRHISDTHAMPVVGDSMEPTLINGAVVFVDTTHVMPSPPDLYVVNYGDGLMVKRIELVPKSKKVRVISDNSDRYATYTMDREDVEVFGRVVAVFQWRG